MSNTLDRRVFRAKFRGMTIDIWSRRQLLDGEYTVYVKRNVRVKRDWKAIIEGADGVPLDRSTTPESVMMAAASWFKEIVENWQAGEDTLDGWKPADQLREKQLMGVA